MDSEFNAPSILQMIRSYPARLAAYGVITFVLFQLLFLGVEALGAETMGAENGPVEMAQVALALMGAFCLFVAAYRSPVAKAALIGAAAMLSYAAARESDQWFEEVFFDDAYKWLVGLPLLILMAATVTIHRKKLIPEAWWLWHQPATTLFIVAGVFLGAVCQTLDRPALWASVSSASDVAVIKSLIEEHAELFAYLMLACSGLECLILAEGRRAAAVAGDRTVSVRLPDSRPANQAGGDRVARNTAGGAHRPAGQDRAA